MFKEPAEDMYKELHEIRKTIYEQNKNISKQVEVMKRNQTNSGVEKLYNWIQHHIGQAEERISEFEDRTITIIQSEEQKENRWRNSEQKVRNFLIDTIN